MLKQQKPLTKSEELALGEKIQTMKSLRNKEKSGEKLTKEDNRKIVEGERALELIVSSNYNLARKIAHNLHKKTGTKYSIDDLIQDAILALVNAAYDYDPSKDCKLGTYAYWGITKKVSTTINYQRLVRMPENKMGEYIQISNAQMEYSDLPDIEKEKYGNELDYVYNNVDIKNEEVDLILTNMQPQVSLNAEINENGGELMDLLVDDHADQEVVNYGNIDESLTEVIKKLTPYEVDLVAFEFGLFDSSISYDEFKEKYSLTDTKVKLEINRVIKKMRKLAEQAA